VNQPPKQSGRIQLLTGVTLWLTGLPCSGKSTIAEALKNRFSAWGVPNELLDGDVVRTHLSRGLGFSKEDRETNMERIGYICSLLTRHGVVAIAALVSPYREARARNRAKIKSYVEIYVKASARACRDRDVKGFYQKAAAGELKGFTGVDDPYEEPLHPEIVCETEKESVEESVNKIILFLKQNQYLADQEGLLA